MTPLPDHARYENRARLLKAMAHPTRLFILDQLAGGERCVCELTARIGADISTVSKHLALLRRAGLVASRKDGLQVFYRLRATCLSPFFDCLETMRQDGAPCCPGIRPRRPGRQFPGAAG
ncbi:MAG: metalloregulator ArsR/SmtB family transcription factor [Lentisphaeria bacterium]|jgi:ArsR family transcriptional regulator